MKDQDQPAPVSTLTPTTISPSPSNQPQPKTYKISTLSYYLSVLYQQQKNTLTITIQDYSTWAVYTHQYGEEDIGKSIDRKMDIFDLFLGFDAARQADVQRRLMNIRDQGDIGKEENVAMDNLFKKYREDMKEYTDYKFGQIVKNGDIMCYKVDKNGIVTVYMNYLDRRTKKQTIHSSTLTLPLSHTFTPEQKFLHETKLQQQDLLFKFISYIKHQNAEKQNITQCLKKIESENKSIRQQNIENKNKLLKMESTFQHFKKKVTFLGVKFQSCARMYREEGIQWKVGIQKKIGKVEKDSKEREREGIQGVKKEVLQLVELFQSQRAQNLAEQSKLKQQLSYIKSKLYPLQLTSLSQPNTSLFQIHNFTLKYIGPDSTPTSYIFNHQIPKTQIFSLKLKFIHSPITWLMFGVIALPSTQPSIIPPSSYQSSNIICCYNTGEIYPGGKNCGAGFKQGEIIELEVNLLERVVRWKVQGQLRCQYQGGMLEEKGMIFRPWVEMYYTGDVVEICQ